MVVTKNVLKHFFDTTRFKTKKVTTIKKEQQLESDGDNFKEEEETYQTVYHQDELINNTKSPLSGLQSSEETVRPIPIPNTNNQQQLNTNIQVMFNNFQFANNNNNAPINQSYASTENVNFMNNQYPPPSLSAVDQQLFCNQDQFRNLPLDNQWAACGSQGSQLYHNSIQTGSAFPNFSNSVESFHATSHSETNSQTSSQANSYHSSYLEEVMGGAASATSWGNLNPPSGGYGSSASSVCSNGFLGDGVMLNPSILSASLDAYTGYTDPYMVSPMYPPADFGLAQSMTDLSIQPGSMYSASYNSTPSFYPLSPQSLKTDITSPSRSIPVVEATHPKYPAHISSKNICSFPGCHKIFSKAYNCSTHYLTHFPNRVKAHVCPGCGRGFDRKYDLGRHMSTKGHHPPSNTHRATTPSLEAN